MIPSGKNYFVYPNGVIGIVHSELQLDPVGGDVFIFIIRSPAKYQTIIMGAI
jgi:hypothetical protein